MTEVRVMQYGCLGPVEGADLVEEQIRLAARYQNQLIALERTRRVVYRQLRSKYVPELAALEAGTAVLADRLEACREQIKSARKLARKRTDTAELDAEAKQLHAELRAGRSKLKEARQLAREHPDLLVAVAELDARGAVWHKALRATCSPFWGTYLLVEASVDQAKKSLVDPEFKRARGFERVSATGRGCPEGRIGVQIQGGMSPEKLYSCDDTRLRIEGRSVWGPWHPSYDGRRPAYAMLWIRVGSVERGAPVWAKFPLKIHRPIPADAVIKAATVHLRMIGLREHWTVEFTYAREVELPPQLPGIVALDLGWRKRPDSAVRVMYWVDHKGDRGEIQMPASVSSRLAKTRDLREIQDRAFNHAIGWLIRWLDVCKGVPDWLEKERAMLGNWRSHRRLRELVFHWRDHRFGGDAQIFRSLEHWMHRSRHLYGWETSATRNALLQRREVYRVAAAHLSRKYGTVVIEKFDLAKAKRRATPENKDQETPRPMRAQLHAAAPGELRRSIVQAVHRDGGLVVELDAAHTTDHCHVCGGVCHWEQAEELHHRCEHCAALWDQDFNAAQNLLRLYQEQFDASRTPEGDRKAATRAARFSKRHQAAANTNTTEEAETALEGQGNSAP